MLRRNPDKILLSFLFTFLLLVCCQEHQSDFYFTSPFEINRWQELQTKLPELTSLNEKIEWFEEVYLLFSEADNKNGLIQYLGQVTVQEKEGKFVDYLYLMISELYWELDNKEAAVYYMNKIDPGSYSLKYNYQEIGYIIGLRIIKTDQYDYLKEKMCHVLLTQYQELVDEALIYYELVKIYQKKFDIDRAVKMMEKIITLSRHNKMIAEQVDLKKIRQEVAFYYSKKKWVHQDLQELINKIKYAIQSKNRKLLDQYVAKVNFQLKIFQMKNQLNWTYHEIAVHLRWNNNIVFARKLEEFSNENEAFLETRNWNFPQMRTWYFYFKKIDYPYDEKIDGGWEWKGIYFGNWF